MPPLDDLKPSHLSKVTSVTVTADSINMPPPLKRPKLGDLPTPFSLDSGTIALYRMQVKRIDFAC